METFPLAGRRVFRVDAGRWTGVAGAALRYDAWAGTLELWGKSRASRCVAKGAWRPSGTQFRDVCSLYVIPNRRCNFRCSYCYASGTRDGVEMDEQVLEGLLEGIFQKKLAGEHLRVVFIGGGEPLLSRDIVARGFRMARRLEKKWGVCTMLGLVTNGSLLSESVVDLLEECRVGVEVSFEVLQDVQETQRGEYVSVAENVRRAAQRLPVVVRTVATSLNVERLEETARECVRKFPGVQCWRCDPVMSGAGRAFFRSYTQHFIGALSEAKKNDWNMRVENVATRCLASPAERFCSGLRVAGPTGEIGMCPCDDGTGYGVVGHYGVDGVELEDESVLEALNPSVQKLPKCGRCFLRWNCAGGCPARRRCLPSEDWSEACRSYRAVASWVLVNRAEQVWGADWAERWRNR